MGTIWLICGPGMEAGSLADALRESGHGIELLNPVEAASAAFVRDKPDAVLFFIRDGPEKTDSDHEDVFALARDVSPVPCGLLSSSSDPRIFARALQNGIFHVIGVPCGKSHLLERVGAMMGHRQDAPGHGCIKVELPLRNGAFDVDFTSSGIENFAVGSIVEQAHKNEILTKCLTGFQPGQRSLVGEMETVAHEIRPGLYEELERALEKREFRMYYQPIVDLNTGFVSGLEALIRWEHPARGLITPGGFLDDLESSDLIVPVGFWVIDEASRQLGEWNARFVQLSPLTMSINISPRQFIHHDLSDDIASIVKGNTVLPEQVRFEITESAFMVDMESANLMLLKLKADKFNLCMDDFGTGYSSLTCLKHFPVDMLKIDQSFVRYMDIDGESEVIVRAVVALAHSLGMTVVGEGIETAGHLDILRRLGCDYGQGYYFSPPLGAMQIENILGRNPRW